MRRLLGRLLLNRWTILAVNLFCLLPIALSVMDLTVTLSSQLGVATPDWMMMHESMEILGGMGIILIGWGVALEERHTLRHVFHVDHEGDPGQQAVIDDSCHLYGLGELILGLFAEVAMECVRVPNRIINTTGIEVPVLILSALLITLGGLLLLAHSIRLMCHSFRGRLRAV